MPRYCVYKPKTSCPECGNPVILDGPLRSIDCPSCFETLAFPPDFWKTLLEDAYNEYDNLGWDQGSNSTIFTQGFQVQMLHGRQVPKCPVCREELPLEGIGDDHEGPVFCAACGKRTSSHSAPDWLKQVMPQAQRLYCAATEEDPDGAQELDIPDENKPVLMACMGCGASLGITTKSPRITACEYCEAENFLPDPLWRRLHPVKKRVHWYVRYA